MEYPGGLNFSKSLGKKPPQLSNVEDIVLGAWRFAHWANWQFLLEEYYPENTTFVFGKGGFQGIHAHTPSLSLSLSLCTCVCVSSLFSYM